MSNHASNRVRLDLRISAKTKQELQELKLTLEQASGTSYTMTATISQLIHSAWKQYSRPERSTEHKKRESTGQ